MVTTFKGLANKWIVLALLLASLGAVLAIMLLPAGAQSTTEIEYAENGTDPVANFTAVDPEGQQVTWNVLGGTDAADFTLRDGVLSFNPDTFPNGPNYEAPADGDTNNVYVLELSATDGTSPGTQGCHRGSHQRGRGSDHRNRGVPRPAAGRATRNSQVR